MQERWRSDRHSADWVVTTSNDKIFCEMGVIKLPSGMVHVYNTDYLAARKSYTSMEFIHNETKHTRRWFNAQFSHRFMVTLAKRFVADIVGK